MAARARAAEADVDVTVDEAAPTESSPAPKRAPAKRTAAKRATGTRRPAARSREGSPVRRVETAPVPIMFDRTQREHILQRVVDGYVREGWDVVHSDGIRVALQRRLFGVFRTRHIELAVTERGQIETVRSVA